MGKAGTKFTGRANGITSISNRYDDDDVDDDGNNSSWTFSEHCAHGKRFSWVILLNPDKSLRRQYFYEAVASRDAVLVQTK